METTIKLVFIVDMIGLCVFLYVLLSKQKIKECNHNSTFTYQDEKGTKITCIGCSKTLKKFKNEKL
jgi:hypothetical protein